MNGSEVWRDVTGYEGLYKVSNKGNVFSVVRKDSMGRECGGRTLKQLRDKVGYLRVTLYKNDARKHKFIHRLVLEAFVPNPNNYPEVNHRDEDKANNCVENLEWCTSKYNNNHGTRIEKSARTNSKKIRAVNVETGEVLTFNSGVEAINKGYSRAVYEACNGIYRDSNGNLIGGGNLYRGHRWSYEEE